MHWTFFCRFMLKLVKKLLKCSTICLWPVIVLPSRIRDEDNVVVVVVFGIDNLADFNLYTSAIAFILLK